MKTILFIFTFAFLLYQNTYCQDSTSKVVQVDFHIPKDWKEIDSTTYVLKDFNKALNYWREAFSSGHQPWRLDPGNTAAACLWEFGIKYPGIVDDFASHLKVIETGKIYSFGVNQKNYMVFVRTKDKIPIAFKLEIKDSKK
jgi:hypothetical protein